MGKNQKIILVVAILSSFVVMLDGFVVNVALPAITRDLHGGLTLQQWVVDAYLLTLSSLMLVAGSLSDLFGRNKVLKVGLWGFGVTSIICAVSPTGGVLIAARAVQGLAGALIMPSALAMIISNFAGTAQSKAIGTWTAWISMATLIGPPLGGFLIDVGSWRWIFAINILPIAVTLGLMSRLVADKPRDEGIKLDVWGAVLSAIGLGGSVYALIEQGRYGWGDVRIVATLIIGIVALLTFLWQEHRHKNPMLPLGLFKTRNFGMGNIATLFIYAALSVATFVVIIFVQQVAGYSALKAGFSLLPVTLIMFFLSPRAGKLAGKLGPRVFMSVGPIVAAAGFLLILRVKVPLSYWQQLLPGLIVFGLGLATTVSPLTSAILGSIEPTRAGVASAVNNAVARIAGLVGIACVGLFVGSTITLGGFHRGLVVIAALLILGGLVSFAGIRNPVKEV